MLPTFLSEFFSISHSIDHHFITISITNITSTCQHKIFSMSTIGDYIKKERKKSELTQEDFARELEQGKETVRLDKVNQALAMFGKEAVPGKREE